MCSEVVSIEDSTGEGLVNSQELDHSKVFKKGEGLRALMQLWVLRWRMTGVFKA